MHIWHVVLVAFVSVVVLLVVLIPVTWALTRNKNNGTNGATGPPGPTGGGSSVSDGSSSLFFNSNTINIDDGNMIGNGYVVNASDEFSASYKTITASRIGPLSVQIPTFPGMGNARQFVIRVNGINTALSVTLSGTQVQAINNLQLDVQAGDQISLQTTVVSGTPMSTPCQATLHLSNAAPPVLGAFALNRGFVPQPVQLEPSTTPFELAKRSELAKPAEPSVTRVPSTTPSELVKPTEPFEPSVQLVPSTTRSELFKPADVFEPAVPHQKTTNPISMDVVDPIPMAIATQASFIETKALPLVAEASTLVSQASPLAAEALKESTESDRITKVIEVETKVITELPMAMSNPPHCAFAASTDVSETKEESKTLVKPDPNATQCFSTYDESQILMD